MCGWVWVCVCVCVGVCVCVRLVEGARGKQSNTRSHTHAHTHTLSLCRVQSIELDRRRQQNREALRAIRKQPGTLAHFAGWRHRFACVCVLVCALHSQCAVPCLCSPCTSACSAGEQVWLVTEGQFFQFSKEDAIESLSKQQQQLEQQVAANQESLKDNVKQLQRLLGLSLSPVFAFICLSLYLSLHTQTETDRHTGTHTGTHRHTHTHPLSQVQLWTLDSTSKAQQQPNCTPWPSRNLHTHTHTHTVDCVHNSTTTKLFFPPPLSPIALKQASHLLEERKESLSLPHPCPHPKNNNNKKQNTNTKQNKYSGLPFTCCA